MTGSRIAIAATALLVAACVAEPIPPSPSPSATPTAIASPFVQASESPPAGDIVVVWNPGTPPPVELSPSPTDVGAIEPCSTDQLDVRRAGLQGETGSMAGSFLTRNAGPAACGMFGRPTIAIVDGSGHRLAVRDEATTDAPAPVALLPGIAMPRAGDEEPIGLASVFVAWMNWCGDDPTRPLHVRVAPPGGGILNVPLDVFGPPRCDAPNGGSRLSVGPFEATTGPEPTDPPAIPVEQLTLTLAVPDRVVAGQTLTYIAILSNRTTALIDLRPCPAFEERLNTRGGSIAVEHFLACDASPVIAPGAEVRFEMRIDVPAAQPADPTAALVWSLDPYGPRASRHERPRRRSRSRSSPRPAADRR